MEFLTLVFNPFRENTYILWDGTGECAIIDSGCISEREEQRLADFVTKRDLKPVWAINTHGHFDHIGGVEFVKRRFGARFAINTEDDYLLKSAPRQAEMYGVAIDAVPTVDFDLRGVNDICFGNTRLEVIQTPGHTLGHVCLYEPIQKILFTGDLLFKGSIGRTDLLGGNYDTLMSSIINRVLPLGSDVRIYPGHGYESTLGYEAMYNPFITEVISNTP